MRTEWAIRAKAQLDLSNTARFKRAECRVRTLDGYRRIMSGEDAETVEAEIRYWKDDVWDDYRKTEERVDRWEEARLDEATTEFVLTVQELDDAYDDTIGYRRWELRRARELDSRAGEWEDDPPMPA